MLRLPLSRVVRRCLFHASVQVFDHAGVAQHQFEVQVSAKGATRVVAAAELLKFKARRWRARIGAASVAGGRSTGHEDGMAEGKVDRQGRIREGLGGAQQEGAPSTTRALRHVVPLGSLLRRRMARSSLSRKCPWTPCNFRTPTNAASRQAAWSNSAARRISPRGKGRRRAVITAPPCADRRYDSRDSPHADAAPPQHRCVCRALRSEPSI